MALDTASEFKKHKDTRKVTFKKDYKGSNGKVRYAAGKVYYMHKDVAKKVAKFATVEEINWKQIYTTAKAEHKKAVKKAKEAQEG